MSYTNQINSKPSGIPRGLTLLTMIVFLLTATATPPLFKAMAQDPVSASAQGTVQATTEDKAGLRRVIITTAKGARVFVNLPDDMAAGDTVSGTVFAEVSGKTEAEKEAKNAELRDYVIDIGGQKVPATGKTFELKIPPSTSQHPLAVVLRDTKDKEVAKAQLPVATHGFARATNMKIPTYGPAGGFIEIGCPCDGLIADSDYVKFGDNKILVVAESPGKIVAYNPSPTPGLKEIEVSEQGKITKGKMSLLGIRLAVAKPSLLRGEKTTLTVEVTGLEGLQEDVPLSLVNHTTTIMTMEPANVQQLTIKPKDRQPPDRFTTRRTLIGIQPGVFHIEGTVINRDERSSEAENRRVADSKALADETAKYVRDMKIPLKGGASEFFSNNTEQIYVLSSKEKPTLDSKETKSKTVAVINYKQVGEKSVFYVVEAARLKDQFAYLIKNNSTLLETIPVTVGMVPPDNSGQGGSVSCALINTANQNKRAMIQSRANQTCMFQQACFEKCADGKIVGVSLEVFKPHSSVLKCPWINRDQYESTKAPRILNDSIFLAMTVDSPETSNERHNIPIIPSRIQNSPVTSTGTQTRPGLLGVPTGKLWRHALSWSMLGCYVYGLELTPVP